MGLQVELQALLTLHGLVSLAILSLLELILGVDNIIFISLVLIKIPEERRFKAKVTALSLAFIMRVIMLFCLVWLSRITTALFNVSDFSVSIRDILFLAGGVYLTFSTIRELTEHLHNKHEGRAVPQYTGKSIILQLVVVDMLFSFDSIFTAIGIIPNPVIMALAVGIGMIFMVYISGKTTLFLEKHPTVKSLALCFIILVGIMLITQAFHIEIPKKYLYIATIIALGITGFILQIRSKKN
jgi:predicted tellurium resistance membrane protein TerC